MASSSRRPEMRNFSPQSSKANLLPGGPGQQNVQGAFGRGPQLRSMASDASINESRYTASSNMNSLSDKFSLSPDPTSWGTTLTIDHPEPDDYLHNPDPRRDRKNDKGGTIFSSRGLSNLGCVFILGLGIITLFAGYPLISYFTSHPLSLVGGFNLGGANASGQLPSMNGNWGLIDLDTPEEARTIIDYQSGKVWQLVFSDEFNTEGRTFYPGDDPYWEAMDLHYWQTNNMEWYDPAAATTKDGALELTLSRKETHDMHYEGGMISSWNKFCFTGGMLLASVVLPGDDKIHGLWPAVWALGNLGRAGYGASLDGMWPYTYDTCDVGTVKNQTKGGLPIAATNTGIKDYQFELSYLPGQRLSRCTCPGESHPGPVHKEDGTYVGRSAPEIDVFEAQVADEGGEVSQSAQWAPFNAFYEWFNTSDNLIIADPATTHLNTYTGAAFQQAASGVALTNPLAYEFTGNQYSIYGFQYKPGFEGAYITWITDNKVTWTLRQEGFAADNRVEIGPRPIPQEPMYLIANLGISKNFGFVDEENLVFPTTMKVDWIRVYQDPEALNIGCDPPDFPTAAYIDTYIEAYTNANLTTWVDDYKQPIPKNRFLGEC